MLPSSSDLHYFIEVASTLNISRAAERLGITQPSLTLALQRLETSVGIPLLLRSRKGVSLTQAGKQLLLHARELVNDWEVIRSKVLKTSADFAGTYTLGCHHSIALYLLGLFIPGLIKDHPALEIKLVHDLSRRITEQVVAMQIDIGVVVNPVRHPDLIIKKVCADEVGIWSAKKTNSSVLICDPSLAQSQDLLRKLRKGGVEVQRTMETSSLEVVGRLVESGAGIGILPGRVANSGMFRGLTRVHENISFSDEICVIYRMENKALPALQKIAGLIETALA